MRMTYHDFAPPLQSSLSPILLKLKPFPSAMSGVEQRLQVPDIRPFFYTPVCPCPRIVPRF